MEERVGEEIGTYRLLRQISKSPIAEVYLGENTHLGARVAMKLFSLSLPTEQEQQQFSQEARGVVRLRHPRLVRVLDFGLDQDQPFLVLDFVPGGTLRQQHPAGTTLPVATITAYVQQIARGLQYIHDRYGVYGALNPKHLMLGQHQDILLSHVRLPILEDFFQRQQFQQGTETLAYLAPERLEGNPTPASDQYALACIVYEWLTGSPPFTGNPFEVISKHLKASPPQLHQRMPSIPESVEQVILNALAKDPQARYPNVRLFAQALEIAAQPEASSSRSALTPSSRSFVPASSDRDTGGPDASSTGAVHAEPVPSDPLVDTPAAPPYRAATLSNDPLPLNEPPRSRKSLTAKKGLLIGLLILLVVVCSGVARAIAQPILGSATDLSANGNTPHPTNTATSRQGTPTPTSSAPPALVPPAGKLDWSSGYYVAWLQGSHPPQTIPWKDFTHIIQFSLTTNPDGSLTYTHGMTPAFMQALVSEAHKHNVKALLSIGGDDDHNWDGACSSGSRPTFVKTLVRTMQTYGYDGLDLDIEQDWGSPTYTDYTACIQQLRTAFDTITPRPLLTMAVVPEWQAYQASHAWQYVDYINMMSYGTNASGIGNLIHNFTSRGFPKSRLGIGIDFVAGPTAAWCGGVAQYAVNNGVGGIMEWVITEDQSQHQGQTPCLDAIFPYVPAH